MNPVCVDPSGTPPAHQPSEFRGRLGLMAAAFTLMSVSSGVWYTASVFFVALIQEFGWDYASTAGIFSTFTVCYGVWGILAGSLLDRFGPRRVILAGGILLPAALASSGLATAQPHLYLTHGVLTPLGLSLMSYVPVSVLVTRNFRAQRGLALGIASAGVGVGLAAVVPLTQLLIDHGGWRIAYFGLAGLAAVVILPIALFALRDRGLPAPLPLPPPTPAAVRPGGPEEWTLRAALRSREFWLITAAFSCLNAPNQLVLTHHVAHLVETGQPKILIAGIVGLVGLVSIPGKIGWGYLADRCWPEWIYAAGCAAVMGGIAMLLTIGPGSPLWSLYVYAVLMGIGYSVSPAMTPIMCGLFFGGAHFGIIFGALNSAYHLVGAAGVWLAGYAHDLTGTYRIPFLASMLSVSLTVILVWLAAPRRIAEARGRAPAA
jgi:MFS family permease